MPDLENVLASQARETAEQTVMKMLGFKPPYDEQLFLAKVDEVLIPFHVVDQITGLSAPTRHRLVKSGEFPAPVCLTNTARRWRLTEVMSWVRSRPKAPMETAEAA
jgi:predicted DNA-binding transcriptional regulator AlpA